MHWLIDTTWLLFTNFIIGYLWHISLTTIYMFFTIYTTKSTSFRSSKLQNLKHKFNLGRSVQFFSGARVLPITFDTLIPFVKPVIIFETMNDNDFVIYHEFAHIKQKHILKHFILTMIISSAVAIVYDKVMWWGNLLIDIVSLQILGRFYEYEADKIAIFFCTTDQLFHAIRSFNDIKKKRYEMSWIDTLIEFMDVHLTEKQRINILKTEIIKRKNEIQNVV